MSQLIDICQCLMESPKQDLNVIFNAFSEDQTFRQTAERLQNVSAGINNAINRSSTRYEGLLHLEYFLKQCPTDVLAEKATNWLSKSIKTCQSGEVNDKIQAFKTLNQLLLSMSNTPEIKKLVTSTNLGNLMDCTLSASGAVQLYALNCLETCLRCYPGASGSHKNLKHLENYLLSFADSRNVIHVKAAAKCLHLLQQVKGGGVKGGAHKTLWKQQFTSCIGSLHQLLDSLYENHLEVENAEEVGMTLSLRPLEFVNEDSAVSRYVQIGYRFNNICRFVQTMLLEPFPVSKQFTSDFNIINLITRGLAVSVNVQGHKKTSNILALRTVLPLVHSQLLILLDSLIICLGLSLMLYAEVIWKLILRVLQSTASDSNGQIKTFRNLRLIAYQVLTRWLRLSTSGSPVESVVENLLTQIINDITPFKKSVKLSIQTGAHKHMSKKERQKLKQTQSRDENVQVFNNQNHDEGNELLCVGALKCLQALLYATGSTLKPDKNEELQLKVVHLLSDVQRAATKEGLFANARARLELYGTLFALIRNPAFPVEPPTIISMKIFSFGKSDTDLKVSEACKNWLTALVNDYQTRPDALQAEIIHNASKSQLMKNLLIDPNEYVFHEGRIISTQRSEKNNRLEISDKDVIEERGNLELLDKIKIILAAKKNNQEDEYLEEYTTKARELIRKNINQAGKSEVAQNEDERKTVQVEQVMICETKDSESLNKTDILEDSIPNGNTTQNSEYGKDSDIEIISVELPTKRSNPNTDEIEKILAPPCKKFKLTPEQLKESNVQQQDVSAASDILQSQSTIMDDDIISASFKEENIDVTDVVNRESNITPIFKFSEPLICDIDASSDVADKTSSMIIELSSDAADKTSSIIIDKSNLESDEVDTQSNNSKEDGELTVEKMLSSFIDNIEDDFYDDQS